MHLTCYNNIDALSKAVFHPKQRPRKWHLEVSRTSLTRCRGQKRFLEQFIVLKQRPRKRHLEVSRTSLRRCERQKRFVEKFLILKQRLGRLSFRKMLLMKMFDKFAIFFHKNYQIFNSLSSKNLKKYQIFF